MSKKSSFQFYPGDWIKADKGWKTPQSYSNTFAPFPRSSAVYVIVRPVEVECDDTPSGLGIGLQVLYVGMSTNLAQRMKSHNILRLLHAQNDYVQVWFQRVPTDRLRIRERRLIQKFNPPYNLAHRPRGEV